MRLPESISDETCPTIAGENTNTCPAGTVGAPYSISFRESDGSGCGPGRQTFHLDSGVLPPGLSLASDGTLSGTSLQPGSFQFYVEMREPEDDPASCAGKRTQKKFTLKIRRQLSIVADPFVTPRSEVGEPFSMTLRARGAPASSPGRSPQDGSLPGSGSLLTARPPERLGHRGRTASPPQ